MCSFRISKLAVWVCCKCGRLNGVFRGLVCTCSHTCCAQREAFYEAILELADKMVGLYHGE